MGLQSTIRSLVGTAFSSIGDLAETVEYHHNGIEADYDPTTGDVTTDTAAFTANVKAVFVNTKDEKQMPSALVTIALPGDQLALIPGTELTEEPNTGDHIAKDDDKWLVVGKATDPATGLWKLLVRKLGGGAEESLVFHT